MLTQSKIYITYAVLLSILIATVAYCVGYNARHTPVYIYVKYETVTKNLSKTMKDIGVPLTDTQQTQLFKELKEAK